MRHATEHRSQHTHLARVASWLSAGTKVALVQVELRPQPGLSESLRALLIGEHRHLYLLQDVAELSLGAEGVLAPARGVAPVEVLCTLLRQTDGRDVRAAWARRKVLKSLLTPSHLSHKRKLHVLIRQPERVVHY